MTNNWYKQSRAVDDENLDEWPNEIVVVHDGDDIVDIGHVAEEAAEVVKGDLGGEAEFATYVKDAGVSEMGGDESVYHNDFPENLYLMANYADGEVIGGIPSYSDANTLCVEHGEDTRFCRYVRHDQTSFRPAADDDNIPDDQLGYFNIHGDRYEPKTRMAHDALMAFYEEHPHRAPDTHAENAEDTTA